MDPVIAFSRLSRLVGPPPGIDEAAIWFAVLFASGIGLYFMLPDEPPPWLGMGMSIGLAAVIGALVSPAPARSGRAPAILLAIVGAALIVAGGLTAAQVRTALVAAPVLAEPIGPVSLVGVVAASDGRHPGSRVTLTPVSLGDDRTGGERPSRVRIRLRADDRPPRAGSRIRVETHLLPPPGPVAPGAFDFRRMAYFQRLGAVGYAVGPPTLIEAAPSGGIQRVLERAAGLRDRLGDRIVDHGDGQPHAVALALLTGQRDAIDDDTMLAIRASGLAHLLAISGLHVGLVSGIAFVAVRFLLVLSPGPALTWPVKKIAAAVAFLVAGFYVVLVGAPVPSQRALVMTGAVLLAVMLDRSAMTLRLVALAGLIVMILSPEAVTQAGFQMSFAAVIALVVGYRAWADRQPTTIEAGASNGDGGRSGASDNGRIGTIGAYFGGVAASTVIAGAATMPFALFHFQQVAVLGTVANLIAVPITALWIMPAGLLAVIASPLGLEAGPLEVMLAGIRVVLETAQWISLVPGAEWRISAVPASAIIPCVAGALWMILRPTPARVLGLAPIAAGLLVVSTHEPPDILISRDGRSVAARDAGGTMRLIAGRDGVDDFTRQIWAERAGQTTLAAGLDDPEFRCDSLGCVLARGGPVIAFPEDVRAVEDDCALANLVILTSPRLPDLSSADAGCAMTITREDLQARGAHSVHIDSGEVGIRSVGEAAGSRPWTAQPVPDPVSRSFAD